MATNKHDEYVFPAFDELHRVEGAPLGCLWGFYDHNGVKDQVGCMSLMNRDSRHRMIAANDMLQP
jgi:hypothetical protein